MCRVAVQGVTAQRRKPKAPATAAFMASLLPSSSCTGGLNFQAANCRAPLGGLAIGALTGEAGQAMMEPFSGALFKGMLEIFLRDMGLLVARNLSALKAAPPALLTYAPLGPLVHATLAIVLARAFGLALGDAILLTVLAASASYIVVPAVLRYAILEANPSLYFGLSLGVTFPFYVLVGIPLYMAMAL